MSGVLITKEYNHDYEISLLYFPDYDNTTRSQLMGLLNFFHTVGADSLWFEYIVSIFGAVLNTLHLIVLSRSSMMTSSTNVLLIGIALCDLFCMLIVIKNSIGSDELGEPCVPPHSLLRIYIDWTITSLRDDFRRCSAWLGVSMTFVRYLVIKFMADSRKFSNPKIGFYVIGSAFLASTLLSIVFFFQYDFVNIGVWKPQTMCTEYSKTDNRDIYVRNNSLFFTFSKGIVANIYMLVNGILSKLIPCILLPVLTVFLLIELRKANKSRNSVSESKINSRNDRTTTFVILMAVTFFISELPTGLVYIFQALHGEVAGFLVLTTDVTYLCNAIFTLNASIHCIICFSMSSQYRDTVFNLLRIKKRSLSLTVLPTNLASSVSPRTAAQIIKVD